MKRSWLRPPSGGSPMWRRYFIRTLVHKYGFAVRCKAIAKVERKRYAKLMAKLTDLELRFGAQ